LAALAVGGSALAGAATSNGTSSATTTTSTTQSSSSAPAAPANMPAHGGAAHEDPQKAGTRPAPAQAQPAAVKAVGSGTAGAVTTDFTGNGYEVTVTKSDGTSVEIHLDSSFTAMQGFGGPGGPPPTGTAPTA